MRTLTFVPGHVLKDSGGVAGLGRELPNFAKPKTGKIRKNELKPFCFGAADEVAHVSTKLIDVGSSQDSARTQCEMVLRVAINEALNDQLNDQRSYAVRRAAILRIGAAAIALLALDERVRGELAITEEASNTDELGHYKL